MVGPALYGPGAKPPSPVPGLNRIFQGPVFTRPSPSSCRIHLFTVESYGCYRHKWTPFFLPSFHQNSPPPSAMQGLELGMHRWTGVLQIPLDHNKSGPLFKIAASLCVSSFSKTLAVPSANVVFFNGDRVEGTGNDVIDELSDSKNIAEVLVSKLGGSVNAWVVNASTFNGPFAVYREFVPSVDLWGNPRCYHPEKFPASTSIIALLSKCAEQVKHEILGQQQAESPPLMRLPSTASSSTSAPSRTVILGFSKGGIVVNQMITELAHLKPESARTLVTDKEPSSPVGLSKIQGQIIPTSVESFLDCISEFHYVDVGLNCAGAYITDPTPIKNIADNGNSIKIKLHGTPRQWCDANRPWIQKEKDRCVQLLEAEACRSNGKLQVTEKLYFPGMPPSLQMHFEIIKKMYLKS